MSSLDLLEDLKIVLLGKSGVGKTELLTRFLADVLKETDISWDSKAGAVHVKRPIRIDGVSFNIEIWDTAGDEKYDSMASMYYSDRAAVIICYDITNSHSFMKAKDWILQLKIHSCKIYLCATKKDLCGKIEASDSPLNNIQKYAEDIQAKFFATSSRTGENINELFHTIIKDFISAPWNLQKVKKQKHRKIRFSWKWLRKRVKPEITN